MGQPQKKRKRYDFIKKNSLNYRDLLLLSVFYIMLKVISLTKKIFKDKLTFEKIEKIFSTISLDILSTKLWRNYSAYLSIMKIVIKCSLRLVSNNIEGTIFSGG